MIRYSFAALAVALMFTTVAFAGEKVKSGPDGLHIQSWFTETSGDAGLDLLTAAVKGKDLIVLVEQNGCYNCGLLHEKTSPTLKWSN